MPVLVTLLTINIAIFAFPLLSKLSFFYVPIVSTRLNFPSQRSIIPLVPALLTFLLHKVVLPAKEPGCRMHQPILWCKRHIWTNIRFRTTIILIYAFYMVILWRKQRLLHRVCRTLSRKQAGGSSSQLLTVTRKMRKTLAEVKSSKFVLAILRWGKQELSTLTRQANFLIELQD